MVHSTFSVKHYVEAVAVSLSSQADNFRYSCMRIGVIKSTCPCECSVYGVNWMVREDHWQMSAMNTYMAQGEDELHHLPPFLVTYNN